ncbi:hypothetical protein [Vibrio mediterranei]|uniref:hypothetical protein n=1 Tax=Vibrio mediterranei TaxID=689 RepID=UPI004067D92D
MNSEKNDNELLEQLEALEASGTALKPKQKAALNRLRKAKSTAVKKPVGSQEVQSNIFGQTQGGPLSTYKVSPTSIRFVQPEIDVITRRIEEIKANSLEAVIDRLGSPKQINQTKLIRAAVLALGDMSDESIIEYVKKAQRNMVGY